MGFQCKCIHKRTVLNDFSAVFVNESIVIVPDSMIMARLALSDPV